MNQIYALKDKKAETFLNPFVAKNSAVATRILKELTQNPETALFKNPEDYSLWWIGSYNEDTGVIIPIKTLECVGQAEDYKIEK